MVAPGLPALKSLTVLPALDKERSMVAPGLPALKSLTVLQALAVMRSVVAPGLELFIITLH